MKKALALLAVLAMALPATAQAPQQDTYGKPETPSMGAPVETPSTGGTRAPADAPSKDAGTMMAPMSPASPSETTSSTDKPAAPADSSVTSTPAPADKPTSSDSAGNMIKSDDKTQTTSEKPVEGKPSGKQYRTRTAPAAAPATPPS
ncbi:MAG: hypothetical protein WCA07_16795 [Gloeobacterales cyanobacterium]